MEESNKIEWLEAIRQAEGEGFESNDQKIKTTVIETEKRRLSLSVQILSILGGIFIACAMMGMAFLTLYQLEIPILIVAVGVICIVGTVAFSRYRTPPILDTFLLSYYLLGYVNIAVGLSIVQLSSDETAVYSLITAVLALLFARNYLLILVSILIANASLFYLLTEHGSPYGVHLYVLVNTIQLLYFFLNEAKLISGLRRWKRNYEAEKMGVLLSWLGGIFLLGGGNFWDFRVEYNWITSLVLLAAILYVVSQLLQTLETNSVKTKTLVYSLTILALVSIVSSPSILGALLLTLLGFWVNDKKAWILGLLSLVYFVVQYYYNLNLTLLTKSILLMSSGVVFLGFYYWLTKTVKSNEKV